MDKTEEEARGFTPDVADLEIDEATQVVEDDDVVSPLRTVMHSPPPSSGKNHFSSPMSPQVISTITRQGSIVSANTSVTSATSAFDLSMGSESNLGESYSRRHIGETSLDQSQSSLGTKNSPSKRHTSGSDPRKFLAFIVTITSYDKINNISDSVSQDGKDLYEILTNPQIGSYDIDNVVHLENPTKKQLVKGLKKFRKRARHVKRSTKSRPTTLTFLAGHTGSIQGGRRRGDYLLCKECDPRSHKRMTKGAVKIKDVFKRVLQCGGRSNILIVHGNHVGENLQGITSLKILLDMHRKRNVELLKRYGLDKIRIFWLTVVALLVVVQMLRLGAQDVHA